MATYHFHAGFTIPPAGFYTDLGRYCKECKGRHHLHIEEPCADSELFHIAEGVLAVCKRRL